MSDKSHQHFWQTPQFAIWSLATLVAVLGFNARGYVKRLETVEEVQRVNLPKLFVAESDVKTIKEGQDKILAELRDINKWLRENHQRAGSFKDL
jgi:hypothetical protein